jgi:hypothetical protein
MKAVELEYRYAEDTPCRGVLGLNASMFKGYFATCERAPSRHADWIGSLVSTRGKIHFLG